MSDMTTRTFHSVWVTAVTFGVSGCANMGQWAYTPPRYIDPAPRVVGRVPLTETPACEPAASPSVGALGEGVTGPGPTDQTEGLAIEPPGTEPFALGGSSISPQLADPQQGPRIIIEGVREGPKLELDVEVARTRQVGSAATFQIVVRNSGDASAENVLVESEFDAALTFPGSAEKHVRQSLGTLVAGDSREIALTLRSEVEGNHCCRFTVFAGGKEEVWKSVCVEFEARQLSLSLVGPQQRTLGSRAEYVIKLANVSPAMLQDLQIAVQHDSALKPREASEGVKQEPRRLEWQIAEMAPGEGVQLQVEFECLVTAENTCLRVDVSGEGFPADSHERCVTVSPLRGVLDVQVSDRHDPIPNGAENEYEITVRNGGLLPAESVLVEALVPSNLRVVSAQAFDGELQLPVNFHVEGDRLRFDPLPSLRPDAVARFLIVTKALLPGDESFVVQVRSGESTESTDVVEITTVNR